MKNRGFTLIELLVVISIIGVLSSIVLGSLAAAKQKGNDAKRKEDLRQIHNALVLYFDTYGCVPKMSGTTCGPASGVYSGDLSSGGYDWSSQGGFLDFLATSGMIGSVPLDPINDGSGTVFFGGSGYAYSYFCRTGNNSIELGAKLESSGAIYWETANYTGDGSSQETGFKCK